MRISGERFMVNYCLAAENEKAAYAKARDICLEQTVEFPEELIAAEFIRDAVVGRIESFESEAGGTYRTTISYAVETAADELTQLLNVIFGNISIKPGISVRELSLPESLLHKFRGPRFGRLGLRERLEILNRPLLHTAIKPMGLTAADLAHLAYQCALGGIDIIKDDHGLTNQSFAPFEERVSRCAEAVHKANQETGGKSIYVANVTAGADEAVRRAKLAKAAGAGGLLVAPALVGLDVMRALAEDDTIGLPIISHPAFQGSYVINGDSGISHYALFGQITRLAGADAVIYPNFGGRFSFSRAECLEIARGTQVEMGHIKPIFPCPGGGMSLDKVADMQKVYGNEVIFLIGGGLFRQGPDLVENSHYFRNLAESFALG